MSILIKGMTMPESCERCPMLDWDLDYIKCKATGRHFKMTECWRSSRVSDCPLVPVPPHGDLIDRDTLSKRLQKKWNVSYDYDFANREVWRCLRESPTVIEAEEDQA